MFRLASILAGLFGALLPLSAFADTYQLVIAEQTVTVQGKPVAKMAINGQIPAPTLHFREGEEVTVSVTNNLDKTTSLHWHGFLIPPAMDGAPGMNGFKGIAPHSTFTYHFPVRQAGTYWYHAHSNMQEQDGLYGAIVIAPKGKDPVQADVDEAVVLSDISKESARRILGRLKADSGTYNYAKPTLVDFWQDAQTRGVEAAWNDRAAWGEMRMSPADLSDVSGYSFLVNGKTPDQNWTALFKKGQKVRLRFVNASAMTFFDVRIPGLKLRVVQADGQNVQPVTVDEFRIAPAETYDVVVQPADDAKAYTIAAEPIDRTGFALGTLAPREGIKGAVPAQRPRTTLTMGDMGMAGMSHDAHHMEMMMHGTHAKGITTQGWANASTPAGMTALSYADLRSLTPQTDTRTPSRTLKMVLGGNMDRYVWTLNGKTFEDAKPLTLAYNERVRLTFVNDTMMAHPVHLHGMFVQLENGQSASSMPNKHTIIVPPGRTVSVLLTANEAGDWMFHCHLLYHMASGMMTSVTVQPAGDGAPTSDQTTAAASMDEGEHHHDHP